MAAWQFIRRIEGMPPRDSDGQSRDGRDDEADMVLPCERSTS
jgi:hypothetical protein